jgi:hypothetical protein
MMAVSPHSTNGLLKGVINPSDFIIASTHTCCDKEICVVRGGAAPESGLERRLMAFPESFEANKTYPISIAATDKGTIERMPVPAYQTKLTNRMEVAERG